MVNIDIDVHELLVHEDAPLPLPFNAARCEREA